MAVMTDRRYTHDELIAAVKTITYQDMKQYAAQMFDWIRFEWLVEGNLLEKDVVEMTEHAEKALVEAYKSKILPRTEINQTRVVELPAGKTQIVEMKLLVPSEKNNCFVKLY